MENEIRHLHQKNNILFHLVGTDDTWHLHQNTTPAMLDVYVTVRGYNSWQNLFSLIRFNEVLFRYIDVDNTADLEDFNVEFRVMEGWKMY